MLSSKGNENGEKTTIGLISKKATLQHTFLICTFLCHCFAQLQRETSRNFLVTYFMKEISYVILHTFFFTATHFHLWPLAFLIFSMPLQIFHVVLQQRKSPLFFITRSSSLSLFFSLSFTGLLKPTCTVSFSLSFSYSVFQIVDMTIILIYRLNTFRQHRYSCLCFMRK